MGNHVALTLRDLDGSARWYQELFGLEVERREESPERRAVVIACSGGAMRIGLVQHAGMSDRPFDAAAVGLDHAAWSVATRDDLDRWQELLAARGVVHSPVVDLGAVAILNLKDPDGIALSLFWDEASD